MQSRRKKPDWRAVLLLQEFVLSYQINRILKFSYTVDKYIKKQVTFGEVLKSCGVYVLACQDRQ